MRGLVLALVLLIAGCAAPKRPVPVVDRMPQAPVVRAPVVQEVPAVAAVPAERPELYVVKRGDTLYGIALDHGLDYRELAEWNELANANVIREGQVLRTRRPAEGSAVLVQVSPVVVPTPLQTRPLGTPEASRPSPAVRPDSAKSDAAKSDSVPIKTEPRVAKLPYSEENVALLVRPPVVAAPPAVVPAPAPAAKAAAPAPKPEPARAESAPRTQDADPDSVEWSWPAAGPLLARFADPANKGLDIGGKKGEPVFASAGGRVVYSGEGLRGYGKLIIIKHNNTYLSAYAHNDSILVREGQAVVKGQKIAEIGASGTDQPKLHFEIRRLGKPVDPLKFLPEKPS